jgi:ribosomal protein L22
MPGRKRNDPDKPEGEVEATEDKPKRRVVPRRKPKSAGGEPAATPAGATEEPASAVVDEPAADELAADEPAAADPPKKAAEPAPEPVTAATPAAETGEASRTRRSRRIKAEPDAPAKPEPRRRRAAPDYGDNPPMVRAHAKYVRTSARKARLVCDHIRGKSVEEARAILAHANRDVARDWSKLLESAVANAEHNHELIDEDLCIHAVKADEGPTLKRFRPRAMGRATKIRKRTSHLSITLTPKREVHR